MQVRGFRVVAAEASPKIERSLLVVVVGLRCCRTFRRKYPGATGDERTYLEGKIAAASFFAKNMLPLLTSTRQVIETIDNEVMELDEATF